MNGPDDTPAWGYIHAGIRPSSILTVGAALTLIAPLLQLWPAAREAAWLIWGGSLVLVGGGLVLSGMRPWFSLLGVVAGGLYLAHAVALGAALAGHDLAALVYRVLAIPKLLSLVLLVPVSRQCLGPHRRFLLGAAGIMGATKVAMSVAHLLPTRGADLIDAAVDTLVAVALFTVARGLRRRENEWAHRIHADSSASFADFNER